MVEYFGCSDHGCVFGHPGGMGTNGGCRCIQSHMTPAGRHKLQRGIAALRARVAELEGPSFVTCCRKAEGYQRRIAELQSALHEVLECTTLDGAKSVARRVPSAPVAQGEQ